MKRNDPASETEMIQARDLLLHGSKTKLKTLRRQVLLQLYRDVTSENHDVGNAMEVDLTGEETAAILVDLLQKWVKIDVF